MKYDISKYFQTKSRIFSQKKNTEPNSKIYKNVATREKKYINVILKIILTLKPATKQVAAYAIKFTYLQIYSGFSTQYNIEISIETIFRKTVTLFSRIQHDFLNEIWGGAAERRSV